MDRHAHLQRISTLGGAARYAQYGNPGTPEGRRLGGVRAIRTLSTLDTRFKKLKKVRKPRHSVPLAELMGILMGDGHLGTYQVSVSTNFETDFEHAAYVARLMYRVFGLQPKTTKLRSKNACVVVLSSKMVCAHLASFGMTQGNKIVNGLEPPQWIVKKPAYARAFARGLIDTDGCVYEDRHTVKGKTYSSTCIAFTSASPELLDFLQEFLIGANITATRWGRHVRIRRKKDVLTYAKQIGFSNPKHAKKIKV